MAESRSFRQMAVDSWDVAGSHLGDLYIAYRLHRYEGLTIPLAIPCK